MLGAVPTQFCNSLILLALIVFIGEVRKTGDAVKAGESVAFIGDSGDHSEVSHLHFELWQDGLPVNPTDYLTVGQ
ncbi:MAG: M23 family metallopeptidase [Crocinitomicaceae bacterium]|nr:M23 family metallopeptidase [Crocinitomicaceae bacterium]